MKSSHMLRRRR